MYNKLFTKILDSSIWLAPDPHRLVWITLIAAMDEDGNCMFACADNVAARARVPVDQAERAIAAFEAPDPKSGDPENEGRRIERIPGGWHVLNAHKYRAMVTKAISREQTRMRTAAYRERLRSDAPVTQRDATVTVSDAAKRSVTQSIAEATSAAAAEKGGVPPLVPPPSEPSVPPSDKPARKRAGKSASKEPRPTVETWKAYSAAYKERYQVDPVTNAKVNGQLSQLVARLGADEAPAVAGFYVGHKNGLYVSAKHCVDLLLRDAEKLRTEWATGNVGYQRDASEVDRVASTGAMLGRVAERLREKGIS